MPTAFALPPDVLDLQRRSPRFVLAKNLQELYALDAMGDADGQYEVAYDVPGLGRVVEADVAKARNGLLVNYREAYMRRRDPDCMVIADDRPTNKARFEDRFGYEFDCLRRQTLEWLAAQELICFPFHAGANGTGVDSVVIAPRNAAFFAYSLGLLQGILDHEELPVDFDPKAVIYVAPPFRHTHFDGKQVVVHNRLPAMHELFSYNLYPGPSAKKGVYGVLINAGEQEGWVTAHCSTVQVVTPYDNIVTFMHEGASGGGKSEMLELVHRQRDGRLLLGQNVVTGDSRHILLPRGCELRPVTDDMALCHPPVEGERRLVVEDSEAAWFVRVNHIRRYGTDPNLEALTVAPPDPLVFLNIDGRPGATALIWEHREDSPGKRCPNPRVILPRRAIPNVVEGSVAVDIRSFGVRTPPCTRENPTYGILGLFHVLPPALAWLWRLVAPRGYDNPSVVGSEEMGSEGVGSYWPFATGLRVDQANLLLRQTIATPDTNFILCPNQHVGAWRTGFMPQWIAREYLARRGSARLRPEQIVPARCPLLGFTPSVLNIEGNTIPPWFLHVENQTEVGTEAYDAGAAQLAEFFRKHLLEFYDDALDPLGRRIIDVCLQGGSAEEYAALL